MSNLFLAVFWLHVIVQGVKLTFESIKFTFAI